MSYQITFTEANNPAKLPITVQDQTLNTQTSITFVGKNYSGFSPIIAENFLHLLENFASVLPPDNPVQGQLWYDSSTGINLLKVFDGTNWSEAGAVKKATSAPAVANSQAGDLWIDTINQQLYLFSGSAWLLVGPQFSAGTKTGTAVETLLDTSNVSHPVLSFYSNNTRIGIVSNESFTPKSTLAGFTNGITQGLNLTLGDNTGANALANTSYKLYGAASSADALNISGKVISSSNFLRSDQVSTTNFPLKVQNDGGISLGSDLSFSIFTTPTSVSLYSQSSARGIDLKVKNATDGPVTLIHLDATSEYVGIGTNNTSPTETLDVSGNIVASGEIYNLSQIDSTIIGQGALVTDGGLSVALNSTFGGNVTTYGKIVVNNLTDMDVPLAGSVIVPGPLTASDSAVANLYDIGSVTRPFRNVFAQSFVGAFSGQFAGTLTGNASGSAAYLASSTNFLLTGDVGSTNGVGTPFNGQTQTGTLSLDVKIQPTFVTGQSTTLVDSKTTDALVIHRQGVGLAKTTQATFLSNVSQVPTGAIVPYAGAAAPTGYLLCDGSEISRTTYATLFQIIGYTYRSQSQLQGLGTFALPDLRGRFPLGADNMNNGLPQIPSVSNPAVSVNASPTAPAGRVTDSSASTVGAGSGASQQTLALANIPQHTHTLNSGNSQYYAPGSPGQLPDTATGVTAGKGTSSLNTGYGLSNSGKISGGSDTTTPITTMNPYLTINYIIKT
jgi:microcystin-dependent protein